MHTQRHPLGKAVSKALALSLGMTAAMGLHAQDADTTAEEALEKITVTAQKRVQRVTDVPVAVSVLRSEEIEAAYANGLEGLQSLVPSVSFRKGNTTRNSALTVRGIGTISFSIAAEPSVATVVDGVVLGRSGQAFGDLYELERVEVLRGPQGTLFGKNASAGVVNITTKAPSEEFTASLDASYFQDNELRFKGVVSGPLGEKAAGSLTVFKGKFDGYIDNVYNNQKVNGYDRTGFRGVVDYRPTSDLFVKFIAEHYEAEDDCCTDLEALPSGRNPASEAAPNSNGVVNGVADLDLDQRRVDHDLVTVTLDETTAFSVQMDKDLGDFTLTSITAYRGWDNTEIREGDFTSIAGDSNQPVFGVPFQLHDVGPQEWRQFSQEFRLASPTDQALQYQLGLFYWDISSERNFTREASCQNNNGQLNQAMAWYANENLSGAELDAALADLDAYAASLGVTCNANDIVSATAFMSTDFTNWAVFGDGTYNFTEDFRLLFGARYTDDEVSYKHNRRSNDEFGRRGVGVRPATENTNFDGETSETDFSGRLGLQYDINDNSMVYATYSQGYKGPGFNVYYNFKANGDDAKPLAPEESDSYEIGYKFASRDVMINLAAFTTDITGFQANNADCSDGACITRLTNAGDVSTSGFEMDAVWNVSDDFTLIAGFAKVDAEIDKFNCPEEATCTDRSGLEVPFAPDLKVSVAGEYVWEKDTYDIYLNANYVYTDEQYSGLPNNEGNFTPQQLLPDYGILNASLGFSFADDAYRITLIGKNLTDESYTTTYSGDGFRYQIPREADRYWGINLRANF